MSNAPEVPRRWLVMRWSEGVSDSFVTYNEQVANHYRAEGCWAVEELFTEAEVARLREALEEIAHKTRNERTTGQQIHDIAIRAMKEAE